MKITYLGHSCFLFETSKVKLLVDPFISGNDLASHIDIHQVKCDYVALSHGHQDHILDAETIARNNEAKIIGTWEMGEWYKQRGFEHVVPMNTGGQLALEDLHLKWVPASHSSSFPDGTYAGNACGMILTYQGRKIYYAGDTALTIEMELIKRFDQPDLCILPIGDHFTMGVGDASKAASIVSCNEVIGMHYDTFPYIRIDKVSARSAFAEAGQNLTLMDIGQSLDW